MSFLKATWWRPATALAALVLAVLALSLSGAGIAQAGGAGSVSVDPVDTDVASGGQAVVSVKIDPPAEGTSVWIVQMKYNSDVVQVALNGQDPVCTAMANPGLPSLAFAPACDVKDTDGDQEADTAVAYGGWVQNDGGTPKGFTTEQVAATFTFNAVGAAGTHSDLAINDVCVEPPAAAIPNCTTLLGPNAAAASPALTDGGIDITEATGTPILWGSGDCDSDVDPIDALKTLKVDAGQTVNQTVAGCPAYKAPITAAGLPMPWGSFDCDQDVDPIDALKQLKVDAGQTVNQTVAGCPAYKTMVTVTG